MTAVAVSASPSRASSQRLRAGIVSRVAADAVDLVIVEILFALAFLGFAFARFLLTSKPFELPHPPVGFTSAAQFLLLTTYLAWGWASTGRTPGKALVGLRVVTAGGKPLALLRAIARAALCAAVGPVLLAWVLVSRRNAGVHDLLLSTAVIYDWRPRSAPPTI
ncbi:MAG TPA: RDD family protein [Acidimicrobiales bacterium]|jgi:uncharacterized RDD family membrane protein YckC|nr:RDD family protein [Acidimicrobiales bacterium]